MSNESEKDKIKQVIVVRRNFYDEKGNKFGMRLGKIIAQACHASNGAAFLWKHWTEGVRDGLFHERLCKWIEGRDQKEFDAYKEWYFEKFTKATVQVEEEEQLLEIFEKAKNANLPCFLVCDEGVTEFKGIPTFTCCAIGPAQSSEIDKITGELKLL